MISVSPVLVPRYRQPRNGDMMMSRFACLTGGQDGPSRINIERLKRDLEELGRIGQDGTDGVSRPSFSAADLEARAWLRKKIEEAGLCDRQDRGLHRAPHRTGPILEDEGLPIGIVERIAGKHYRQCAFVGESGHSGTTPLELRHDAFLGLADFALRATQLVATKYYGSVLTVGKAALPSGSFSVIPGRTDFTLEFRSSSPEAMAAIEKDVFGLAEDIAATRGLTFMSKLVDKTAPVTVAPRLTSLIDPERALATVRAVVEAVPGRPVTLKLRRAFRNADRTHESFWRIALGAFRAGVSAIAVHARSVEQKYTGRADWEFLAEVKRAFPDRTILGSGDVTNPAEALRMMAETGVDGVLAARGAIGNPWFFSQARDLAAGRPPRQPALDEQREVIDRHYRLACEAYDPRRGLKILRHFSLQYAKMHPRRTDLRNALVKVRTEDEWRDVIDRFYASDAS